MTEDKNKKKQLSRDQKILVKNSFFSILHIYGGFFLSLITSFFMARIITQQEWGYLILALSYNSLFSVILIFFPPSLGVTINYYVARYHSLNQNNKLKSFIKNAFTLRILFVSLVYIIAILCFIFIIDFFKINLENYTHLFLILSPIIIINGLNIIMNDISRSLNLFNLVFYLLVLYNIVYILGLLFLIFFTSPIKLEDLALVILVSYLIPFIINIIYLFIKIKYKIKKTEEPPLNLRKSFLKLYKYGLPFSVKDFGDILVRELHTQSVGIFESPEIVTGYNIGVNFSNVGSYSINSFGHPLSVSFTRLYAIEKIDEVVKIYQKLFHYILFIVLIVSGFLFFVIDFFLFLIYGETYLDFSLILKIMIISIIFNVQNLFFYGLIRATNKGKKIIPIYLLLVPLKIVCFIIIIMYFGIISALISLMILNFIYFIALLILSYKIFKIKTNVIKVLFQYISFFVSLGITILLDYAFLNNLNNILLNLIHLSYFKYLNIFLILVFCFSYIILNFIFKIITKKDLNNIELLLEKKNFVFKLVKKVLNLFKKIVRD